MNLRRFSALALVAAAFAVALTPMSGCGASEPLDKVVELTEVQSGYVDMGLVNGETKLVPYATFRVKNTGKAPLEGFQLSAAYWRPGEDGQKDETLVPKFLAKDLAPGAVSDPITVRATFGYTLAGARADFFAHSMFVDFIVKVFGKVNGRMFRMGEVNVERKIVPKESVIPTT